MLALCFLMLLTACVASALTSVVLTMMTTWLAILLGTILAQSDRAARQQLRTAVAAATRAGAATTRAGALALRHGIAARFEKRHVQPSHTSVSPASAFGAPIALGDLPAELVDTITQSLDSSALARLAGTCHAFRSEALAVAHARLRDAFPNGGHPFAFVCVTSLEWAHSPAMERRVMAVAGGCDNILGCFDRSESVADILDMAHVVPQIRHDIQGACASRTEPPLEEEQSDDEPWTVRLAACLRRHATARVTIGCSTQADDLRAARRVARVLCGLSGAPARVLVVPLAGHPTGGVDFTLHARADRASPVPLAWWVIQQTTYDVLALPCMRSRRLRDWLSLEWLYASFGELFDELVDAFSREDEASEAAGDEHADELDQPGRSSEIASSVEYEIAWD